MSDLQLLHQLQELDLQIESRSRALREIEAELGQSDELTAAQGRVKELQERLHDQERQLRELEWRAEEIGQQAREDEQKLYGGKIRNPKELDGLRRDLEQRQARRREVEDRELQLMGDVESTQSALQRAHDELAAVRASFEAKHSELVGQHAQLKEQHAALDAERAKVVASIAPASLAQYEQLRRDKRGRAVSVVERSTCQGCRIALPMSVIQRVRAGREFVFCPSCGRILYA